ncbi:MAG: Rieske 2Fe-2S domain-containing protein [Vicinamibacteria bacterium]|nr:Rieske 2Fe-2S domain-containing protein [Vicinamibacteria bacterium]
MRLKESLITRGQFINGWLSATASLFLTALVYPVLRFLETPGKDVRPTNVALPLKDYALALNSAALFPFGSRPGLLIRTEADEWIALDAVCTHFECTVRYDSGARHIHCPCHNGFFDIHGRNTGGPPPRPLERYQVRIEGDALIISREGAA